MATILILHSSVDGHTIKICHRLKQVMEENNHQITELPIEDCHAVDLPSFDKIVIGASIRYGRHRQSVFDFIDRHRELLENKASAFFSVNIVARKPGKDTPQTNPYMRKFLRQIDWHPSQLAVFAGKLDYPRYGIIDRQMIRMIMWITKGPTDPATVVEFTDWQAVEAFGRDLGRSSTEGLPSVPHAL